MDPTTTAEDIKVNKITFVDMDAKHAEDRKTDEETRELTRKQKKAAYMHEYHKRRRAAHKAKIEASINSKLEQVRVLANKQEDKRLAELNGRSKKDAEVVASIDKEVTEIAKSRLVSSSSATYEGRSSNVVDFAQAVRLKDPETIKLWMLSQAIDSLVVSAVADGLKPTDIAGVVANRLKAVCEAAGPEVLSKIKEKIL